MQAAREHDFAVTMIEMGGDKPYALADASRRMVERPVDGMILNMNRMAPDFEEFVPSRECERSSCHVCASALHDDRLRPVWFVRAVDQLSAGTWSLEYAVCGGSGNSISSRFVRPVGAIRWVVLMSMPSMLRGD
ncbi:MAG: hypothetical protein ACLRM9_05625 [Collinsella aerofaciens]